LGSAFPANQLKENPVKFLHPALLGRFAALALLLAPLTAARAQALKPVAIVSIASVKENMADVSYVTRAAGMADYGDTAKFFVSALSAGIDKERPIGLYVLPPAPGQGGGGRRGAIGDFHAIAFVPLEANGLATILKVHKEQLGEPRDVGNGILEVGKNNKTAYIKEQAGWAFIAENKDFLTGLAQDPASLLGDLTKNYNVAVKLMVQNIPDELRRTAIDEIKVGMERFLESPAARRGNIDREQARQLVKLQTQNIEKLINEADEVSLGLGVDEAAKHVVLDIGFAAKEGTSLARAMALQADARTNFAGFMLPEASVTINITSTATKEDIEQVGPALQSFRTQMSKQIDDSPDIPADKREAIKSLLQQYFDVLEKTIAEGKIDGGGVLLLLPRSVSFAFGGGVADGAAVEKIVRTLVDLGKDIPNFPKLEMNVSTVGDMKVHRLLAPIPPAGGPARDLFGENLEILVAIGPKSTIVSGGKDAQGLLKKILERSAQERNKSVAPFSLNVAMLPILKFSQSVDNNPIVSNVLRSLEQSGNDRVTFAAEAAARKIQYRFEVQEGVIKAVGEGVKAAGAGRR
jgi:hypothetical protein